MSDNALSRTTFGLLLLVHCVAGAVLFVTLVGRCRLTSRAGNLGLMVRRWLQPAISLAHQSDLSWSTWFDR